MKEGLKKGDKINLINNKKIDSFEDIYEVLENNALKELSFEIEREKQIFIKKIKPESKTIETFVGTERNISFIGIEPLFIPKIGQIQKNTPASNSKLLRGDIPLWSPSNKPKVNPCLE